ncbi:DinB family protein [Flavivirga eckloniae]|uniref:DinB family protein n=1 Tax=Flavivirga eckloniae TaxID=1803846 RepID=UPI0018F8496A|nr:DinB family protein [Flavivirga eckloniae]
MNQYRNNGAIGAILDEYEKALTELENIITDLSYEELIATVDNKTEDFDCKSIQTILTHVIRAGYCYIIEIRKSLGEQIDFVERRTLNTVEQYKMELKNMFNYNELFFKDYPNVNLEENDSEKKILVKWGQVYDIEQLFEHAIVHILRHRRQIERFKIQLRE